MEAGRHTPVRFATGSSATGRPDPGDDEPNAPGRLDVRRRRRCRRPRCRSSQFRSRIRLFISYASEDQPTAALLAEELHAQGVKPWFAETELTIGMGLRRSIDHGLAHSRFGLVILSHAFFQKEWPQRELDGLVALQVRGRVRVLPVWHGLTHDDVLIYSPTLADTIAARTSESTIQEIAAEIARVVLDS